MAQVVRAALEVPAPIWGARAPLLDRGAWVTSGADPRGRVRGKVRGGEDTRC